MKIKTLVTLLMTSRASQWKLACTLSVLVNKQIKIGADLVLSAMDVVTNATKS